jgi:adenylyltransferase/sulfurtransferase
MGNAAALLAIRTLAQVGEDSAGKLQLFDGLTGEWRSMRLPADPKCRACGS